MLNIAVWCSVCCRDRAATARKALTQKGGRPTSTYRGVTHHVRTGRWEAHVWLEGKQVSCGGGGWLEGKAMQTADPWWSLFVHEH